MLRKKNIWLITALLLCVIFYLCIPISVLVKKHGFLSYFGAFLITISFALFIFSGKSKLKDLVKNGELPIRIFLVPIFLFILLGLSFTLYYESLITKDTIKNGTYTIGEIISGKKELKTNGNAQIRIRYTTHDGKILIREETISAQNEMLYMNKEIELYYSKHDPYTNVIVDHKIITKFFNSEDRELKVKDLILLFSMQKNDIKTALNKIGYKWIEVGESFKWYNERKQEIVEFQSEKLILTRTNTNYAFTIFDFEIKELGYKRIDLQDENSILYSKDGIYIELRQIEVGIFTVTISQ